MAIALKPKTQIKGMACGARHSFFWTTDGQCYSFGNNFNAQLGYNFSKTDFKDNQVLGNINPFTTKATPLRSKIVWC